MQQMQNVPYETFYSLLKDNNLALHDRLVYLVPYGASLSKQEQAELQATANRARYLANRKRYL